MSAYPDDVPDYAPDFDLDAQYEDRFSMPDETTEDYPGEDLGLDPADSGNYDAIEESASDPVTGTTYGDLT
jgi:hypothetical protein